MTRVHHPPTTVSAPPPGLSTSGGSHTVHGRPRPGTAETIAHVAVPLVADLFPDLTPADPVAEIETVSGKDNDRHRTGPDDVKVGAGVTWSATLPDAGLPSAISWKLGYSQWAPLAITGRDSGGIRLLEQLPRPHAIRAITRVPARAANVNKSAVRCTVPWTRPRACEQRRHAAMRTAAPSSRPGLQGLSPSVA